MLENSSENLELLFLLSFRHSKMLNFPIVAVNCKSVSETYFSYYMLHLDNKITICMLKNLFNVIRLRNCFLELAFFE